MSQLGTRLLTLDLGGNDVTGEISKSAIGASASDSDFVTFLDAASGGKRQYALNLTLVQDPETGSLWDQVWSHAGETVPFIIKPHGNAVPTPAQPHFEGNCTITEPDGDLLGGEANASTSARFTIEVSWVCDAKPTKVTA